MIDWREHITGEPGESEAPSVKGSGVRVEVVLRLLRDGCEIERILSQFPGLSHSDVRACIDYAVVLLERTRFHSEVRRRIAEGKAHPERGISLADLQRELSVTKDDE